MDFLRPAHHHHPGGKYCHGRYHQKRFHHLVALEDDVVGLRKAHDEHGVDDAKAHQVLGEHPVDHDHHRADQLEAATEEEEVESVAEHDQLGHRVLQAVQAGQPDRDAELEKDTGEEEADPGGAERHVLQENCPSKESELPDSLEEVEESHEDKGGLASKPDLVSDGVCGQEMAAFKGGVHLHLLLCAVSTHRGRIECEQNG